MKLENIKSPTIYVLVGPPGSGKSTWIRSNCDSSFVVISTDDELELIAKSMNSTYNEIHSTKYKQAEATAKSKFAKAIKDNKNIVWDQTNMGSKKRRGILSSVPGRYRKVAVVFNVEREELDKRLEKRRQETGKHIPKSVVDDMINRYEYPSTQEGFNEIIEV